MEPRVGDISGENNVAVTLTDEVTRGLERGIEIIEAHLVELLLIVHSHDIVAEGNEGHMDGFHSAEQIRINGPGQNDSVNQSMLLKNGRQVDPIGKCLRGIMQGREQHVLFQTAGIGFDALQDARMKRMEKIAIAQEKADHFRAAFENSAGLRIGAKSEAADGIQRARAFSGLLASWNSARAKSFRCLRLQRGLPREWWFLLEPLPLQLGFASPSRLAFGSRRQRPRASSLRQA